jgi:chloride channel protein, CIC family
MNSATIRHLIERLPLSESVVLGGAAIGVGLASGISVWIFKRLIDLAHLLAVGGLGMELGRLAWWLVALVPVVGGLAVGLLAHFFIGEERHHGVAGIMEAAALAGGRLRYQRTPIKALAAAVSIGFGASVGPEDPSVQIGAGLGSLVGQRARLSDERVRALVAAGAAGGIAAAFNAPIAGVFFALEIILGEISGSALGLVLLAAVISAVFTQAVSGTQPAFHIPAYPFRSAAELPLYLGLGLLAGLLAALYVRMLYVAQDAFHAWRAPRWLKPAAAGLAVGVVGLWLPQAMGVGYEAIEQMLGGVPLALGLLLALLLAKLILTPISIGSGFPGGVFAPSLFLGAALGAAYGLLLDQWFPALQVAPAAFALVGMAAVLAGAVHAPLTAILLLFEMTNDYRIILPLMFAVFVSLAVSQWLQPDSVYALGLARKGIRLDRGRDVDVLHSLPVSEVMQTDPPVLYERDPLTTAIDTLTSTRRQGLPVLDAAGALVGIITMQDIDRALAEPNAAAVTVGEVCSRDLLVAYSDETVSAALQRMSVRDIGRLPVVSRRAPRQLVGLLRRNEIVRAYDAALTRRAAKRHSVQSVRLDSLVPPGVQVEAFRVMANSACVNQTVSAVAWPRECVLVSLRRGRDVMIPHGDTLLQAGDNLVVAGNTEALHLAQQLCELPDVPAPTRH